MKCGGHHNTQYDAPFFQQCEITVTFGFRRRHSWERTALKSWGRWRQGTILLYAVQPPSAKKWRNPEVFLFLFFPKKKGSAGLNSLFFKKWTPPVHKCCIAGARHHQSGWTFRDKYLRRRRQFHICDTTFSWWWANRHLPTIVTCYNHYSVHPEIHVGTFRKWI